MYNEKLYILLHLKILKHIAKMLHPKDLISCIVVKCTAFLVYILHVDNLTKNKQHDFFCASYCKNKEVYDMKGQIVYESFQEGGYD